MGQLVDPFRKEPLETIFAATAEMDALASRYEKKVETFTEHLQQYAQPSFWQRLLILFFGVQPQKILRQKIPTEADLIISSLELEPEKWKLDQRGTYTIGHTNGVNLWIANGESYLKYYDCPQSAAPEFRTKDKEAIWSAIESWKFNSAQKNTMVWDKSVAEYAKTRRATK